MYPVLLHLTILALLAVPIVRDWMAGQPGHQAAAAGWAIGLLFLAGLWLTQFVLSTGLLVWRYRVRRPTLLLVIGIHVLSAAIIVAVLYTAAWFMS